MHPEQPTRVKSVTLRPVHVLMLTVFAMCAFAANSILCRVALKGEWIDPFGFAVIRVLSATLMLWLLICFRNKSSWVWRLGSFNKKRPSEAGTVELTAREARLWLGAIYLSGYLLAFSWAYLSLSTASGAIFLFASVQLTLLLCSLFNGYRPSVFQWLGFVLALGSFVWWLWPQAERPDVWAAFSMIVAGISWAFYTQVGHASKAPLLETHAYFLRSIVCVVVLSLLFIHSMSFTTTGIMLAMVSGACASALGYVVWFVILPYLNLLGAGVVQLLVPILAALAGVVFASELPSTRLWVSIVCIILGLALVLLTKKNNDSANNQ